MKLNSQKGFIVQGVIAVVALIAIATGAYYLGTQKESSNVITPNLNDDHSAPDSIIVNSPKAGEKLEIGKTYTVSWENYRGIEDLNIVMVGQGPARTSTKRLGMVSGTKSGTYNIVVPDLDVLDEYNIEVYPDGGREWVGRSGVFTIYKSTPRINQIPNTSSSIKLTYPNGGEKVIIDSVNNPTLPVKFTLDKPKGFSIFLIDSNGNISASWATDNRNNTNLNIDYKLNVSGYINYEKRTKPLDSGKYKVKVCDYNENGCDTSDGYFTITSTNNDTTIKVISPNGGEKVNNGSINFSWSTNKGNSYTPTSEFYALLIDESGKEVKMNNQLSSKFPIGNGSFSSSFDTLDNSQVGKKYKVKVCDELQLLKISCDISDDYFTISGSTITN